MHFTNNVSLGIVNGHIWIIDHRVMALVNVQKKFLSSSSLPIWSIMINLHEIGRSKLCISTEIWSKGVICPCPRVYTCINNGKRNIAVL